MNPTIGVFEELMFLAISKLERKSPTADRIHKELERAGCTQKANQVRATLDRLEKRGFLHPVVFSEPKEYIISGRASKILAHLDLVRRRLEENPIAKSA